jgi:hypothetical protein
VRALKKSPRRWQRFPYCIKAHKSASNDPCSQSYQEKEDGTYLSPNPIQADVMYVTTSLADESAAVAEIMIDHKVFLECGFHKIVDMIRQKTPNTTKVVSADSCTFFDVARDTHIMINRCGFPTTVVHPYRVMEIGREHFNGKKEKGEYIGYSLLDMIVTGRKL